MKGRHGFWSSFSFLQPNSISNLIGILELSSIKASRIKSSLDLGYQAIYMYMSDSKFYLFWNQLLSRKTIFNNNFSFFSVVIFVRCIYLWATPSDCFACLFCCFPGFSGPGIAIAVVLAAAACLMLSIFAAYASYVRLLKAKRGNYCSLKISKSTPSSPGACNIFKPAAA